MSKVVGRSQCPKCAEHGQDTSGDNLIHYEDSSVYCFACGFHTNSYSSSYTPVSPYTQRNRQRYEISSDIHGLSKEVLKAHGCYLVASDTEIRICFPYVNQKGQPVKIKHRRLTGTGFDRDFKFSNVGAPEPHVPLFGFKPVETLPQNIIIFEGERDLLMYLSTTRLPEDWHAMALPGVTNARNAAVALSGYKGNVYLVFDQDEAGKNATAEFLKVRPLSYVNTTQLSKDVCDYIAKHGVAPEFTWERNDGLCRDYLRPLRGFIEGINSKPLLNLPEPFGNFMLPRQGAFFIVAGNTGSGKSFFIDWLINLAINQNKRVLLHSLELLPGEVLARLVYQTTGERTPDPGDPVVSGILSKLERNLFINTGDSSIDTIKNQIVGVCGVDIVIVDTISLFARSMEWDKLIECAYQLKALSVNQELGAPMVVGVSQMSLKNVSSSRVSTDNLFGASGIAQAADMVLFLQPDNGLTNFRVLKRDRVLGAWYNGILAFDFKEGVYYETTKESQSDMEEGTAF